MGGQTIPNSIEVVNLARIGLSWEDRLARALLGERDEWILNSEGCSPFIFSSFLPILRAAVPFARSSLSITVDEKRKELHAV